MRTLRRTLPLLACAGALAVMPAAALAGTPATPIIPGASDSEAPATTLPTFTGSTWAAKPITATKPPQNPYMAANGGSNLHNDSWMSDAYWRSGPLGKNLVQTTNNFGSELPGLCASVTFDSHGRIISVCPSVTGAPTLRLIDPTTLDLLAQKTLPGKECSDQATNPFCLSGNIFQDFTGGGYFYLDNHDHAVTSTNDRKLRVYGVNSSNDGFDTLATYDLTGVLSFGERLSSALPDWNGNIWFVSKNKGKVGWINTTSGAVHSVTLNEEIENSFMVAQDGVYVASDKALYKFDTAGGAVHQIWRSKNYGNTGKKKPGQVDAGTGTTPTMLSGGLVAITDNSDPMKVVVYNGSTGKQTCAVPVFGKGASATENSLIGAGTASKSMLIVENNYGYDQPASVTGGATSKPGFTRIDVTNHGKTCKLKWKNTVDSAPTVVPKLSVTNGLLYAFTKPKTANGADAWFWTAIDAATGKTVWKRLAGNGYLHFNNNYSAIHIGPDGSLYLGLIGGLARLRDGS